jgi:uncharacterized protein YecA (UPF0149 family)
MQPVPQPHIHAVTNTPAGEISDESSNNKKNTSPQKADTRISRPLTPNTQEDINKNKLGRNDPCWCGSGKKFKKCHWPNLA